MDIYDLLGKIDHTEDQDKVSYSAGVVMAMSLKDMGFEDLKYDDFTEGMKTIFDKMTPKISPKKSIDIFNNYVTLLRHELSLKNEEEGKAFLEKNRENPKITELENGLQYEILVEGNGGIPTITDAVEVEYEGYLLSSQVFDSTKDVGAQVFNIQEMILGWQEVLTRMQEGSRWKVYIPSHLAYGENGAPPMILPNATLVFIIELNKIM
ncbi:peptidyl-prolyl cis-trans isomerase [Cloacibacterium rupense]|uniref:Peptidyl-prolyl cis-trans isomerase n=1 Tax=Cloacibacterium rupense TaxID=517423 RepID=A0ABQ2NIX2_9FLAO|nr:FKBP-type peptidyl-prolyl cis-trans isomerase [Cloacibacterium rupense]GGP02782.1 peptidyl-prolyl cis-trans isomerase [Cloacibacterium rupense]